jgi:hypothetical protein
MRDPRIGQFVAAAPALGLRHDQAAAAQARQVVGQDLPRHPDLVREVGRIARPVAQHQQDFGARDIR